MFGPLKIAQYLRICESIQNSKILSSIINPLAAWAQNAAGYRKLGLKYDDLLMDDTEIAQEALARLPRSVLNDRVYRFRTAFQLSIQQTELPQEKWITPKTDDHYLLPLLVDVQKEFEEKEKYNNLVFKKH